MTLRHNQGAVHVGAGAARRNAATAAAPGPVELYPQPLFASSTGLTLNGWTFGSGQVSSLGSGGAMMTAPATQVVGAGTYRATYSGSGGSVLARITVFGTVYEFTVGGFIDATHDFVVAAPANQLIGFTDVFDNEAVQFSKFSLVQIA